MFILRSFRGVGKFGKSYCPNRINVIRLISSENPVRRKNEETVTRSHLKQVSKKELKNLNDNFLQSLFTGTVDRRIFEYPEVLRAPDTEIVLDHSSLLENFLKDAPKNILSEDTIQKLRELELFGLTVPQKYGGADYNETECKFIQECLGSNFKIGRFLGDQENFGCRLLSLYGTEEQKKKYLPKLAQGKCFISLAYLENGPLIDLSKIEAQAIKDEEHGKYIILAEKKWVHDADKADLFFVLAKASTLFDETAEVGVKFTLFMVDRDSPGVTIHKLKSDFGQENSLYDISFKNVHIPRESVLGNFEVDGYQILKNALSHSNVTDAVFCCNILKRIMHDVIQFIGERNIAGSPMNSHSLIQENLASIVIYTFALESIIYLITGRYDTYNNPDLFQETIFAKILGVEFLQVCIKKYIEIVGRESFLISGILEEAIKAAQYYSVFDENIEFLKLLIGAEGVSWAAKKLSRKVRILRNPFDHNWEAIKRRLSTRESNKKQIKKKLNLKLELHESLRFAANTLDDCYSEFQVILEDMILENGALALENEHVTIVFGEMAAYLYALIACLSRASSSICYNFSDHENELRIVQGFASIVESKIKQLHSEGVEHKHLILFYQTLGEEAFNRKEYPVEHPLSRTF